MCLNYSIRNFQTMALLITRFSKIQFLYPIPRCYKLRNIAFEKVAGFWKVFFDNNSYSFQLWESNLNKSAKRALNIATSNLMELKPFVDGKYNGMEIVNFPFRFPVYLSREVPNSQPP